MKRSHSLEEDSNRKLKMSRLEVAMEGDNSMFVASGSISSTALGRHFAYELSDKKAKSNLLKGAARDVLEIAEKQKCTMFTFSVGAFLEAVIPTVEEWGNCSLQIQIDNLKIVIEEVTPGFDDGRKHVETLVRFLMHGGKITVCLYNTTQRIKVEGKGYQTFVRTFLQPIFCDKISRVSPGRIDKYKRCYCNTIRKKKGYIKTSPKREVQGDGKAALSFMNNSQLNKHKKTMHTRGGNDSNGSIRNIPITDDLSLLDISCEDATKQLTLEETH